LREPSVYSSMMNHITCVDWLGNPSLVNLKMTFSSAPLCNIVVPSLCPFVSSYKVTFFFHSFLDFSHDVFGRDNSRWWFIYFESLNFFAMKYFVWIEILKSI